MEDSHEFDAVIGEYGLENHGLRNLRAAWWNLPSPALYDAAIRNREAVTAHLGPLVVRTGQHTGRSPNDRFIVREPSSENKIWWGKINRAIEIEPFERLRARMLSYLEGRQIFVQDCYAGADPDYQLPIRIITEQAWHNLFARNMFIRELDRAKLRRHVPEFTVIQAPSFSAVPDEDGTNSGVFIIINLAERVVLIGGTAYAGEIKKSIFSVMNYLMPQRGVLPMHCSANIGPGGDTAVFFGLSGTGKTTLSADPARTLIGDDEHGWSDRGVFNFEGGCYAKVIRLSPEAEPEIYQTTRRFGTILENVGYNALTRRIDLDDATLTENTRAAYPIKHIANAASDGLGGHPRNIIFLTADAFGVLPPIAKLTLEQAMYHFISGYTAKVAGTEDGVKEPQPNFSACFGAPFLPLHPSTYADLLGEKISRHGAQVWLINTGWSGGPYGVGQRMKIAYTRAMVAAALDGSLDLAETTPDPIFGIRVPNAVPGVPDPVLQPRHTWPDPAAYDAQARRLAGLFVANFAQYEDLVTAEVLAAAPKA